MKRRKPARADSKSKPVKSLSPSDQVLAILRDNRKPLTRRYQHAKDCLKRGVHVPEALAVLGQVTRSGAMSNARKDMALRLLSRHERKNVSLGGRAVMMLPVSWRELVGCVEGEVRWVSDEQWDAMRADGKKRWLPQGFALKNVEDRDDD